MGNLIRFYNQNRKMIWIIILIAIAIIVLIQRLNNYAKTLNAKELAKRNTTNTISEVQPNYEITTGETIAKNANTTLTNVIDNFINYLNNGNIDAAYNLLSNNCKNELYQSKEEFVNNYYNDIFYERRTYSTQLWAQAGGQYTYRVGLSGNILSTGNLNDLDIEDYYTVVYENGSYKLNINGFIGTESLNTEGEKENIKITALKKITYMDYVKYQLIIENGTQKSIKIDSGEKTNTLYIEDNNRSKIHCTHV